MKKILKNQWKSIESPLKIYFLVIFAIGFAYQSTFAEKTMFLDYGMWANQAKYVVESDTREFDALQAYGHPGGPIILSTIAITKIIPTHDYDVALPIAIALIHVILIALLTYVSFLLFPKHFYWKILPIILFFHYSYRYNTPPSMIIALTIPLQCFYTLYLCKKEKLSAKDILLFSLLAGFSASTRTDIGGLMSIVMGLILIKKMSLKETGLAVILSFLTFFFLDPFMYFMPIQHIGDIFHKAFYHYKDYAHTPFQIRRLFQISTIAFSGMAITLYLIIRNKIDSFFNKKWIYTILGITVFLYVLYLASHYKAERYFLPLTYLWEIILLYYLDSFFSSDKRDIMIYLLLVTALFLRV